MTRGKSFIVTIMVAAVAQFAAVSGTQAETAEPAKAARPAKKLLARGKYLVKIAGCNDCHTPGYMQLNGKVPEEKWLTGESFGWRGPWGTTYAVNLRLFMANMSQGAWMKLARSFQTRPPMPWYAVRDMTEEDLRAIYAYIRYLGPSGDPAPGYLQPDQEPKPPYMQFHLPPQ